MSQAIDIGTLSGTFGNNFQRASEAQHQGVVVEPGYNDYKELLGRVRVIGAHQNKYFPYEKNLQESNLGAHPGEIAVVKLAPSQITRSMLGKRGRKTAANSVAYNRSNGSKTRDAYPWFVTTLNGMSVDGYTKDEFEKMTSSRRKAILRKGWRFGGVVKTHIPWDRWGAENRRVEGTLFKGGVFSMDNTGNEVIYAGQKFMWDFPDPFETPYPHRAPLRGKNNGGVGAGERAGKVLVATVPVDGYMEEIYRQVEELKKPEKKDYVATLQWEKLEMEPPSAEKFFKAPKDKALSVLLEMDADVASRTCGRFLITTPPADQADVQLNKHH